MQAILLILKNSVGALALYFAKRYATELIYDVSLDMLDKLADYSDSDVDDNMVDNFRKDRGQALKIIKGFI
tara:strand:- start:708 stop:920 length:213 start_codon:yes stop_codon:yes gene_type:complete